jgi:hypothetical protein
LNDDEVEVAVDIPNLNDQLTAVQAKWTLVDAGELSADD